MNACWKFAMAAVGSAALTLLAPGARAQLIEQKISVTFSGPVEVPGEVLPAGTYVFEALQDGTMTRILSPDERHVYATLLTVPAEKVEPVENATVILGKAGEGIPQRVDSWFFPGENIGSEFVYGSPQHHKRHGALSSGAKDISVGAKDVAVSTKTVAVDAAHVGTHMGAAVYHAGKFVVG
jgi:hypothetical protein